MTAPRLPRPITQREWEVIFLVRQGHGYEAIAERLGISWRTVEAHVVAIASLIGDGMRPLASVRVHAEALLQTRPPVITPDPE